MESFLTLPNLAGLFAAAAIWLVTELSSRLNVIDVLPKKAVVFALAWVFGLAAHYIGGFSFDEAVNAALVALSAVFVDSAVAMAPGGKKAKDVLSGKNPAGGGLRFMLLIALLAGSMLGASCSRYAVENVEYGFDESGNVTSKNVTRIRNTLPAGAKDASQGTLAIAVDPDGAWSMDLGQASETDLLGTSNAMQGTLGLLMQMAQENARLAAELEAAKGAGVAAGAP